MPSASNIARRHRFALPIGCLLIAGTAPFSRQAQSYPSKSIRVIVAFAPGGGTDILSRVIGQSLQDARGVPVVIENRPGASGRIGTEAVARAAPDGHTLLGISSGPFVISPTLTHKLNYDPSRDFAPITLAVTYPYILVTHPSVPAHNLKESLALAKARPGKLNFAGGGYATPTHLVAESFKLMGKVDIPTIGYNGTGAAHIGVLTGDCDMLFGNVPTQMPHLRMKRLRALGITSASRTSLLPELQTVGESGLPGFVVDSWYGWLTPAGTPPHIVAKLNQEIVTIVNSTQMKQRLQTEGANSVGDTPAQFTEHMKADTAKWARVIKAANIKSE
jgi:tripartite-type tricarboxylate transporter receptor subunit TctC